MPAPDPSPSPRDRRRRQRQISAYLSELRTAHGREGSRLRRIRTLRPGRRSAPPDTGGQPAQRG